MSLISVAKQPTEKTRFAAFLVAALALHGLLLLLPAHRGLESDEVLHRLSVSLLALTKPAPKAARDPVGNQPAQTNVRPDPAPAADIPEPETAPAPPPRPDMPEERRQPELNVSTARLLDHAHRMRWELPEDREPRPLGLPAPGSQNDKARSSAALERARREASISADGLEIVDRWLAADGSHNVLLRTRAGGVLCGRAEAWDPLHPLVEQVMMWRDCGSAEPTFEWPESYRARRPNPR